jgi:hypothetical protein
MIKVNIENNSKVLTSEFEVTKYLFEIFNDRGAAFDFQRLTYSNGSLEDMEYLTFDNGRVRETYNTNF